MSGSTRKYKETYKTKETHRYIQIPLDIFGTELEHTKIQGGTKKRTTIFRNTRDTFRNEWKPKEKPGNPQKRTE